jgi:hypothetical protein
MLGLPCPGPVQSSDSGAAPPDAKWKYTSTVLQA